MDMDSCWTAGFGYDLLPIYPPSSQVANVSPSAQHSPPSRWLFLPLVQIDLIRTQIPEGFVPAGGDWFQAVEGVELSKQARLKSRLALTECLFHAGLVFIPC